MIRKILATAAACAAVSLPAAAQDGMAAELGHGDDHTVVYRAAAQWNWSKAWPLGQTWRLAGYWDVSAAIWENPDDTSADIGLTPVFRFERPADGWTPYLEAAIGVHLVSRHISSARVFSTAFQFGDHLGAGLRFGERGRYDLSLRAQHISNGSIREPNPGINFAILRFQVHLQ